MDKVPKGGRKMAQAAARQQISKSSRSMTMSPKKENVQWRHPSGPSREELMERLREEGVDTVDKVVDKLLAFRKSNPPSKRQEGAFLGSILANPGTRPKGLKQVTHYPPQVPLYVDGVAIDGKDISQFDGRPLEFVVTKQPNGELALYASTGTSVSDYMKGAYTAASLSSLGQSRLLGLQGPSIENQAGPGPGPYNYGQVQMFQDIEYQNNWFWCAAGQRIPDLRQVSRDCTLWWCGDWNDQISSTAATESWVAYYWDIWYQNSVLWQQPLQPLPDLRLFGWNDQISSVWDTGIPY